MDLAMIMERMMLTKIYTTLLDFMVTLVEACRCQQVDDDLSGMGE